ncbi:polcalcin Jun o 2 [Panicum miliaceum]|uniref:Polcalcin Jun o 2 n=1 Tax=Panicum miliaceum TaxID=4540 RepID=A0A3L6T3X9_PANMI|nr:polcalcin Jun o 2 [Panicum miliaceum]
MEHVSATYHIFTSGDNRRPLILVVLLRSGQRVVVPVVEDGAVVVYGAGDPNASRDRVFRKFDTNGGDGLISRLELVALSKSVGHVVTNGEVLYMMEEADLDDDGAINMPEFIALMRSTDANADAIKEDLGCGAAAHEGDRGIFGRRRTRPAASPARAVASSWPAGAPSPRRCPALAPPPLSVALLLRELPEAIIPLKQRMQVCFPVFDDPGQPVEPLLNRTTTSLSTFTKKQAITKESWQKIFPWFNGPSAGLIILEPHGGQDLEIVQNAVVGGITSYDSGRVWGDKYFRASNFKRLAITKGKMDPVAALLLLARLRSDPTPSRSHTVLQAPDLQETRKNGVPPLPTPAPLLLPPPVQASAVVTAAKPKGFRVGAAAKKLAAKGGRPLLSPTSTAAAAAARKVRKQHLKRFLGLNKMSTTTGSDGSSNPQCGSEASHVQSDSVPISGSPYLEPANDSLPIEIDDDEEEEDIMAGSKRNLKLAVWNEFTKVKIGNNEYAKC